MEKKYKLLENDTKKIDGRTLYRIEALKDFLDVKRGDNGGYIESEDNLSHDSTCWIYDNACVYDNAKVLDKAWVGDNAWVSGNACICDTAIVYDNAQIYGNALLFGDAEICGDTCIYE